LSRSRNPINFYKIFFRRDKAEDLWSPTGSSDGFQTPPNRPIAGWQAPGSSAGYHSDGPDGSDSFDNFSPTILSDITEEELPEVDEVGR